MEVFFCNIYLNLAGLSIKPSVLSILLALTALSTSLILIPLLLMMILFCVWGLLGYIVSTDIFLAESRGFIEQGWEENFGPLVQTLMIQ